MLSSGVAKARNAILIQFISDACCVPCHWQYDSEKIKKSVEEEENPLLFPTESKHWLNPFYRIEVGNNSLYGDEGRALLISLSKNASFDALDYAKTLENIFGTESLYGVFPEENVTRDQYPVQRGWRPHSIKYFLSHIETKKAENTNLSDEKIYLTSGSSDDQSDCLSKISPFVGQEFVSNPNSKSMSAEVFEKIEKCVTITQNGKAISAALCGARIIYKCLQTESINENNHKEVMKNILEQVLSDLNDSNRIYPHALDNEAAEAILNALSNTDKSHVDFVAENGKGCGLFFNFVNCMHAVLVHSNLKDALRNTIAAGGDCVARSNFIGAVFGALYPMEHLIDNDWTSKYKHYQQIQEILGKLFP